MYSFIKPNGETAHILDAWTKGCASGINILIDETEHVAPIVYATMLAIDPGLNYADEEELYNNIFDNIGNMNGVVKNSIRYILYKDNNYHYLLVSVI